MITDTTINKGSLLIQINDSGVFFKVVIGVDRSGRDQVNEYRIFPHDKPKLLELLNFLEDGDAAIVVENLVLQWDMGFLLVRLGNGQNIVSEFYVSIGELELKEFTHHVESLALANPL